MKPIQNIDARIAALSADYARETTGRAILSARAKSLARKIAELQAERDRIIADERHALGSLLPDDPQQRNEIYRLLVKLPIVSDFLYSTCVELRSVLKRHGLNELTMTEHVRKISTLAKDFAFLLTGFPELEKILSADDTLIAALDKKTDSFLKQRMKTE